MKEVRKTTKPFRYGLNQIPYDYAGKVRHRLKGLDLIDRVPEDLWMEVHDIVSSNQDHHKKKKGKKENELAEEALKLLRKEEKLKSK